MSDVRILLLIIFFDFNIFVFLMNSTIHLVILLNDKCHYRYEDSKDKNNVVESIYKHKH